MEDPDDDGRPLEGTHAIGDIAPAATALPPAVERWRQRSVAGAVLTGVALGLQEALTRPREEPTIVVDAPGEPPGPPQPIELKLDPDSPAGTVVVLRPWLMPGDEAPD